MYGTQFGYNGMKLVLGEISASNPYSFSNVWTTSYQCIRRANTVFARIDEAKDLTAQDRAELLSLNRFIRAYAYYKLWLAYGPVILVGDEEIPSNLDLGDYDRLAPRMKRLWNISAASLRRQLNIFLKPIL